MARRTEITIETSRLLVIRRSDIALRIWCDVCLAEVPMITPNDAAALMNLSSRSIYRWIEDGRIHFVEGSSGLLVCTASLPASSGQIIETATNQQ